MLISFCLWASQRYLLRHSWRQSKDRLMLDVILHRQFLVIDHSPEVLSTFRFCSSNADEFCRDKPGCEYWDCILLAVQPLRTASLKSWACPKGNLLQDEVPFLLWTQAIEGGAGGVLLYMVVYTNHFVSSKPYCAGVSFCSFAPTSPLFLKSYSYGTMACHGKTRKGSSREL